MIYPPYSVTVPLCLDSSFYFDPNKTPATVYVVSSVFQLGRCIEIAIPMLLLMIGVSQVVLHVPIYLTALTFSLSCN